MPELKNAIDIEKWTNLAIQYGLQAVFAAVILVVGWMAAKFIRRMLRRVLNNAQMDATLSSFLSNIVYALVLAFVVVATLNKVGVQTASLIAVIGAAGLAVGLALQGSLSNFAAGIMIILFKHFRVGDSIEGAGITGTVQSLDIFNTVLLTPDNQKVVVPNARLTEDAITNFSSNTTRRIDITLGIGYDDDIALAKESFRKVILDDKRILQDKEIVVAVKELGASSVDLVIRCWTNTSDYWDAYFDLLERIKLRFDTVGLSIPYPQTDIHLIRA